MDQEPLVSLDPKDLLEIKEKKETLAFLVQFSFTEFNCIETEKSIFMKMKIRIPW